MKKTAIATAILALVGGAYLIHQDKPAPKPEPTSAEFTNKAPIKKPLIVDIPHHDTIVPTQPEKTVVESTKPPVKDSDVNEQTSSSNLEDGTLKKNFEGGRLFVESNTRYHSTDVGVELYTHTKPLGDGWVAKGSVKAGAHTETNNTGPLLGVSGGLYQKDHEGACSVGLTGEHAGAGCNAMKDLIETKNAVFATGFAFSAGVHGFDIGPQVELGGAENTITFSLFDIKIGERQAIEGLDPSEYPRKRYSINPLVVAFNVVTGQKSALDVIGIPAKQLNPFGRLIKALKEDEPEDPDNPTPVPVVGDVTATFKETSETGNLKDASSLKVFRLEKE